MAYETQTTRAAPVIEFGPPPETFPLAPFDLAGRDPRALGEQGLCCLLTDTLIDLTGPVRSHSSRLLQQVTGGDGLQSAASVQITFDPQNERLIVHTVRVWRDGVARETASPAAFELFRRELNLERAIYDGRVSAHMIVPDVRVGDMVETAFTVMGGNPALKDTLSCHFRLQWGAPTLETRCRLRTSETRPLAIRGHGACPQPVETVRDGVRELDWRVIDAPTYRHETDAPGGYTGYAGVHVCDRMSWAEVADVFRVHYEADGPLSDDLAAAVDALAAKHATQAARAAEGLRFVQCALRYHSIGVGEGGFRPRPVEAIWSSRYGDCKDASRLLTAVLRRLGVDACPALVNTWSGSSLGDALPSTTAFDHCIVRVRLDGRTWWLDATFPPQSGRLETMTPSAHHFALPLEREAQLEVMAPLPMVFAMDATETWRFGRRTTAQAKLEIVTVYGGWRADDMRRWRDNDSLATVSRRMREGLEGHYGVMSEAAPLAWNDDPEANRLELTETYLIDHPFVPGEGDGRFVRFETRDDVVAPNLRTPETGRRNEPIIMGAPRRVRTRRILHFPVDVQITPWTIHADGPGLRGLSAFVWRGRREGEHTVEIEIRDREIPAVKAPPYFAFARRMWSSAVLSVAIPVGGTRLKSAGTGQTSWISWAVVAVMVIGLAVWRTLGPG